MAQVDASIPLATTIPQAPNLLGQVNQAQNIALNQQQLQQNQLKLQQQQDEAQAFKGADFSTPEGRNQALVSVMQKDPQAGMALMKQFSELDRNQAQSKHLISQANVDDLKTAQGKQKVVAQAALPAWNAYQKALAEGKPDQVARAEADKLMPDAISTIQQSGVFSSDEVAKMPRVFDPAKVGGALMASGIHGQMIEDQLKEAQTKSATATAALKTDEQANPEKYHQTRETGASVYEGADGKLYSVNPNKPNEPAQEIQAPEGLHKPGTGSTSAQQKTNVRAATVAASANNSLRLLDSIQKEFGGDATTSPIFGEQPTGMLGKTALAAEKQLVPAKSQKLDARANSFIDEAGPAFTGGLRVNSSFRQFLTHQLPQWGDPPEVAQEKWKNFKDNISGASDTFKKAYSGNPDYWSKDDKGTLVDNPDNYVKGGQPPSAAATPDKGVSKPAPRPNAGDVVNGYKFKGGDPNSQANWEKQ